MFAAKMTGRGQIWTHDEVRNACIIKLLKTRCLTKGLQKRSSKVHWCALQMKVPQFTRSDTFWLWWFTGIQYSKSYQSPSNLCLMRNRKLTWKHNWFLNSFGMQENPNGFEVTSPPQSPLCGCGIQCFSKTGENEVLTAGTSFEIHFYSGSDLTVLW